MAENKFGKCLREMCLSQMPPISQEKLAELIGRSKMTISQFETGKTLPPQGKLLNSIIEALDVNEEEETRLRFLSAQERHALPEDIRDYFFSDIEIYEAMQAMKEAKANGSAWACIKTNAKEIEGDGK